MPSLYQLISWPIFGLIVGAAGRFIMPGKQPIGLFLTMILGMVGSFVGGFFWFLLGRSELGESAGFIMSTLGAFLVLYVYQEVTKQGKGGNEVGNG